MKKYTSYTFFYSTKSPFSNWHKCDFQDKEGVSYNSTEQYMMAEKARIFGDSDSYRKILASKDPREQKELGRKVSGFKVKEWENQAKDIVFRGCYLKFTQNPELLNKLLGTRGTLLVEASPYDTIWGIGLSADNPDRLDPSKWKGRNWLGEILTRLRDGLEPQE